MLAQAFKERSGLEAKDATIAELETLLKWKLRGQVHDLRIRPREQGVSLHGYAYTYYAKQLAQHALMSATSVPILSNEISVV